MTPADAIREIGRAQSLHETAYLMHRRSTGIDHRVFHRAADHVMFHRGLSALCRSLRSNWSLDDDPAEIRRRAEALARQMELGAEIATATQLRAWDEMRRPHDP